MSTYFTFSKLRSPLSISFPFSTYVRLSVPFFQVCPLRSPLSCYVPLLRSPLFTYVLITFPRLYPPPRVLLASSMSFFPFLCHPQMYSFLRHCPTTRVSHVPLCRPSKFYFFLFVHPPKSLSLFLCSPTFYANTLPSFPHMSLWFTLAFMSPFYFLFSHLSLPLAHCLFYVTLLNTPTSISSVLPL